MKIPNQLKHSKFCRIQMKSKAPFEKKWQKRGYSFEEISNFNNENYGVICGYNNLAVIDCDEKELEDAVKKHLPDTFSIKTGSGGMHYYYFIPDLEQKMVLKNGEKHLGEIQSYGSQVVGAGSIHPNGKEYTIFNNVGIKKISLKELNKMIGNFSFNKSDSKKSQVGLSSESKKKFLDILDKDKKVKQLFEGNFEGYNLSNEGELGLVLHLVSYEFNKKEIFEIMSNCKIGRWLERGLSYRNETYRKALASVDNPRKIIKEDFLIIKHNKKGEEVSRFVDIDKVSNYLISKHNFVTWFGQKSDYSFNYNGKIFVPNSRGVVKVECEKLLGIYCKKNIVEEVFDKIKRKSEKDKEQFEKTDVNLIPLKNGVWHIKKKKLLEHDPKYNFQFIIPQTYNKEASCIKWFKFIEETLYPEDVAVMQEWFGFCLYRDYFIKKALICEGKQDTGKSVLLDTLIEFIGEKNKSGLSLQKISSGSDFIKLSLKNKHGNIYDDLSSQDLNDGGAFKVATGGGYISGEEKFGEYQQFRSFAKQVFATNKIPPVKDNDDLAYFGRWINLKFDNIPEKIDPFLRAKLWTEKEMSGILNWALEGLYRLLKKGKFSYDKTSEEVKQSMEISGVPLVAFSLEVLEQKNGAIIDKEEMYKVYTKWCNDNEKPRLTKENLGRQLTKYCNYIISVKHKKRVWQNAILKGGWDTSDTISKHICLDIKSNKIGNIDMEYIKSQKVSEVSKELNKFTDKDFKESGYTRQEYEEMIK